METGKSDKVIITKFGDPKRYDGAQNNGVVDTKALRVNVLPEPFFIPSLQEKPAELSEHLMSAWEKASAQDPSRAYARCIRLGNDGSEQVPHLQLFSDDVMLGNLDREGFLRLLLDPNLPRDDNLRRLRERLRELRRYANGGVLRIDGVYLGVPQEAS